MRCVHIRKNFVPIYYGLFPMIYALLLQESAAMPRSLWIRKPICYEGKKQELYHSIYDDAMWLMNLTENLLSITRIDNGSMRLKMEAQLLAEVFDEALRHVDRHKRL